MGIHEINYFSYRKHKSLQNLIAFKKFKKIFTGIYLKV